MSNRLPESIRPLDLVRAGARMEGELGLRGMTRLAGRLAADRGAVRVSLHFGRNGGNVRYIKGRVETVLELTCQRCLEVMQFPVDIGVSLGIIGAAAEAERLPAEYEPLLLGESEAVSLVELVEDELLLALPIVARHALEACYAAGVVQEAGAAAPGQETHRPFAGLADLMKSR